MPQFFFEAAIDSIYYFSFYSANSPQIILLSLTLLITKSSITPLITRPFLTFRYYSTRVASNRTSATPSSPNLLNPYWVTGFTDAEGSFTVNVVKSSKYRLG